MYTYRLKCFIWASVGKCTNKRKWKQIQMERKHILATEFKTIRLKNEKSDNLNNECGWPWGSRMHTRINTPRHAYRQETYDWQKATNMFHRQIRVVVQLLFTFSSALCSIYICAVDCVGRLVPNKSPFNTIPADRALEVFKNGLAMVYYAKGKLQTWYSNCDALAMMDTVSRTAADVHSQHNQKPIEFVQSNALKLHKNKYDEPLANK